MAAAQRIWVLLRCKLPRDVAALVFRAALARCHVCHRVCARFTPCALPLWFCSVPCIQHV
jgi:hypothetical protein